MKATTNADLVRIQNDGTVEVDLERSASVASELLEFQSFDESTMSENLIREAKISIPQLQIVILVVGTRGDIQPFLTIAKRLQEYGHRVRVATLKITCRNITKTFCKIMENYVIALLLLWRRLVQFEEEEDEHIELNIVYARENIHLSNDENIILAQEKRHLPSHSRSTSSKGIKKRRLVQFEEEEDEHIEPNVVYAKENVHLSNDENVILAPEKRHLPSHSRSTSSKGTSQQEHIAQSSSIQNEKEVKYHMVCYCCR
ncbi:hypothetical protein HN51_022594 [Arachis hypogaea]